MSAKGRGPSVASGPEQWYPTPQWCVLELLRRCPDLPGGVWCEPAAGDGAIVRAVEAVRPGRQMWMLCDIRQESLTARANACPPEVVIVDECGDFLKDARIFEDCAVYITNPPFTLAEQFVRACIGVAHPNNVIAMLLRSNFQGSEERIPFWRDNAADIYPLCPRPSFIAGGGTDACEYAWFVWTAETRSRGYSRTFHPAERAPDAPRGKRKAVVG